MHAYGEALRHVDRALGALGSGRRAGRGVGNRPDRPAAARVAARRAGPAMPVAPRARRAGARAGRRERRSAAGRCCGDRRSGVRCITPDVEPTRSSTSPRPGGWCPGSRPRSSTPRRWRRGADPDGQRRTRPRPARRWRKRFLWPSCWAPEPLRQSAQHSDDRLRATLGEFERAIAAGREGLRIATGDRLGARRSCAAYINGSQAIDDAGRIEEALALGIEGIAAAERLGMSRGRRRSAADAGGLAAVADGSARRTPSGSIQPGLDGATTPFNVAGLQNIAGHLAAERGEFEAARAAARRRLGADATLGRLSADRSRERVAGDAAPAPR